MHAADAQEATITQFDPRPSSRRRPSCCTSTREVLAAVDAATLKVSESATAFEWRESPSGRQAEPVREEGIRSILPRKSVACGTGSTGSRRRTPTRRASRTPSRVNDFVFDLSVMDRVALARSTRTLSSSAHVGRRVRHTVEPDGIKSRRARGTRALPVGGAGINGFGADGRP
jgi:hypothetical protein